MAQIPTNPNQQATFEKKMGVVSTAREQGVDNSSYKLSHLKDIEIFWENPQLEVDPVFRPGIDILFSPKIVNNSEMEKRGSSKNPNVLDDEEDKENSPPTPLLPKRPNEPRSLF